MKKVLLLALFLYGFTNHAQTIGLMQPVLPSAEGYLLFAPLYSQQTYLIDKCGRQVKSWSSRYRPGQSAYLLHDGSLLRCANDSNKAFASGGGRIEKFSWEGKLLWSYAISTPTSCLHHDIYPMPNGNILALLWEKKPPEQVKAWGRNPEKLGASIWMEKLIEIKPIGKDQAKIVWEWNVWDHLVQDFNKTLPNFGEVAKNPQLINLNYQADPAEDWLHFNAVVYNAALNQIMISNRNFGEIYIIERSSSSLIAAGHKGGKYGKGGDILYRWGNPEAYNCGSRANQKLFSQHSPHWIAPGMADEGKILIFNNGTGRQVPIPYSSVEVLELPPTTKGQYTIVPGKAFEPQQTFWTYRDSIPVVFYSKNVSNAQRLKNGNTLICEGANGRFFEIDPQKNIVWTYINPVGVKGIARQGEQFIQNPVFRCTFYPPDYPAFKGKKLAPAAPIEIEPVPSDCR